MCVCVLSVKVSGLGSQDLAPFIDILCRERESVCVDVSAHVPPVTTAAVQRGGYHSVDLREKGRKKRKESERKVSPVRQNPVAETHHRKVSDLKQTLRTVFSR